MSEHPQTTRLSLCDLRAIRFNAKGPQRAAYADLTIRVTIGSDILDAAATLLIYQTKGTALDVTIEKTEDRHSS